MITQELNTFTAEIKIIHNSYFITPISQGSNDMKVLSPTHFFIGETFMSLPEVDYSNVQINRLSS
jgi:hypothetical protein